MKRIKKNLFSVGLAFSMILGLMLSVSVEKANAYQVLTGDEVLNDTYSCFTAGISHYFTYRYVDCSNCAVVTGKPVGPKKSCLI